MSVITETLQSFLEIGHLIVLGVFVGLAILFLPAKMSVMVVFGILIAVVILLRTDIGLLLTLGSFPFEVAGGLNLAFSNAAFQTINISAVKILGLLTAGSWAILFLRKKAKFVVTPQLLVIIGLIITGALSIFFGTYHGIFFFKKGKNYLSFYVIYFGIFFMVSTIVNSKELLKKLIMTMIFLGVITSIYAFVQRFTPSKRVEILSVEDDYYRSHGVIVDYAEKETLGIEVTRVSSVMAHPDSFALFLSFTIALSIYFSESYLKTSLMKFLWGAVLMVQFLALGLTLSRGGAYTTIIIIICMAIKGVLKPSWEKILITFATICIIFTIVTGSTTALNRVFSPGHVAGSHTFQGRLDLIKAGLNMFRHNNWFIGVGMGNFEYNLPDYSDKIDFTYEASNDFLRVLTEMGIIGLLLLLTLYTLTFRDMSIAERNFKKKNDIPMYNLTCTIKACLVGFFMYSLTQVTLGRQELPLVMSLAIVMKNLSAVSGDTKI